MGKLAVEHFARAGAARAVGRIRHGGRSAAGRGRSERHRGLPRRAGDERAPERSGRIGDRACVAARRSARGRDEIRIGVAGAAGRAGTAGAFYDAERRADARVSLCASSRRRVRARRPRVAVAARVGGRRGPRWFEDLSATRQSSKSAASSRVSPREGEELVRLSPRRGFLFTPDDPFDAVARVRDSGVLAYDATGALAGSRSRASSSCAASRTRPRRLPPAGPFSRVSAIVLRDEGERFRVYVPQELGHDVALAVLDAARG